MPNIFRDRGFRVFFYANEGNPPEPMHVHVRRAEGEAKFWLHPEVRLAKSYGFDSGELRTIERLLIEHMDEIREAWNEHFGV